MIGSLFPAHSFSFLFNPGRRGDYDGRTPAKCGGEGRTAASGAENRN